MCVACFFALLGKYKIAALEKFGVVAISRKTVSVQLCLCHRLASSPIGEFSLYKRTLYSK